MPLTERIPELRLGPTRTDADQVLALREIEDRINRMIRTINSLLEELDYVEPDT